MKYQYDFSVAGISFRWITGMPLELEERYRAFRRFCMRFLQAGLLVTGGESGSYMQGNSAGLQKTDSTVTVPFPTVRFIKKER